MSGFNNDIGFSFFKNGGGSSTISLTNTYVGYGSVSNTLTGSPTLTYNNALKQFKVVYGASVGDVNLNIDSQNKVYGFGDLGGFGNSTFFKITDNDAAIGGDSGGGRMLLLQGVNQIYSIGDIDGASTNALFTIDASSGSGFTSYIEQLGERYLIIDNQYYQYGFGDLNGKNNGTYQLVDDSEKLVLV